MASILFNDIFLIYAQVTLISPWEVDDSSPNYRNILVEEKALHHFTSELTNLNTIYKEFFLIIPKYSIHR